MQKVKAKIEKNLDQLDLWIKSKTLHSKRCKNIIRLGPPQNRCEETGEPIGPRGHSKCLSI